MSFVMEVADKSDDDFGVTGTGSLSELDFNFNSLTSLDGLSGLTLGGASSVAAVRMGTLAGAGGSSGGLVALDGSSSSYSSGSFSKSASAGDLGGLQSSLLITALGGPPAGNSSPPLPSSLSPSSPLLVSLMSGGGNLLSDPPKMSLSDLQPSQLTRWVVIKCGGSTKEQLNALAAILKSRVEERLIPFLVCSAPSKILQSIRTLAKEAREKDYVSSVDTLLNVFRELAKNLEMDTELLSNGIADLKRLVEGISLTQQVVPSLQGSMPRLEASLIHLGETLFSRLVEAYLNKIGIKAQFMDARTVLMTQESHQVSEFRHYLEGTCKDMPDHSLRLKLEKKVADAKGLIFLTQCRVASDIEAKFQACRVETFSESEFAGFYTADPRFLPDALLLPHVDYGEAQELATLGVPIIHPACLPSLRRYRIPLHIYSIMQPSVKGTVVSKQPAKKDMDKPEYKLQVKSILAKTDIVVISLTAIDMWMQVGFLASVFTIFTRNSVSIAAVATSETNVTVSLDNKPSDKALAKLVDELSQYCITDVFYPCVAVSLLGSNLNKSALTQLGVALNILADQQIRIISHSSLLMTFVFGHSEASCAHAAVQALHDHFVLGPTSPLYQLYGAGKVDKTKGPSSLTSVPNPYNVHAIQLQPISIVPVDDTAAAAGGATILTPPVIISASATSSSSFSSSGGVPRALPHPSPITTTKSAHASSSSSSSSAFSPVEPQQQQTPNSAGGGSGGGRSLLASTPRTSGDSTNPSALSASLANNKQQSRQSKPPTPTPAAAKDILILTSSSTPAVPHVASSVSPVPAPAHSSAVPIPIQPQRHQSQPPTLTDFGEYGHGARRGTNSSQASAASVSASLGKILLPTKSL